MVTRIEKIVKNLDALPSLPIIAHKLMTVIEDRGTAAKDLAEVISKDPAMTAKVLKLVNSSFFGFSSKITVVSRAVVVLGFNTLKNLALGISVFKTAQSMEGESTGLDMEKFWEHSLAVAAGARLIARLTRYKLPEEAFIAGLLHDIGKIIFNQYMPEEFSQAIEMSLKEGISLEKAERKFIGADHEVAGDYLAERWKLPYAIRKVISQHHKPPISDSFFDREALKLICIVSLSNTLCKIKDIGFSGNKYIGEIDDEVLNWFGIEEGLIERFFLEIDNEFSRSKEFLGLTTELDAEHAVKAPEEIKHILIIKKDKKKISMAAIFLKSLGFECQEVFFEDMEDMPRPESDTEHIFTDALSREEMEKAKNIFTRIGLALPIVELPVPFNSGIVLQVLGISQEVPKRKKVPVGKKVLIISKDQETMTAVTAYLKKNDFHILALEEPDNAVVKVKEFQPRLIVFDGDMPETKIVTLIKLINVALKEDSETEDTGIIVLTGDKESELVQEIDGIISGEILKKPVDEALFLKKVNELTQRDKEEVTILCIDDEENILKSLKRLLEDDYNVMTARSAGEGVALYKEHSDKIRVILVDFRMPVITGMECIQEIKKVNPDIACIVLSGVKDFGDHLKEQETDLVYALMDKPWDDKELLDKIKEGIKISKK